MKKNMKSVFFFSRLFDKVDGDNTLSTIYSSVAYDELKSQKLSSIVEVNFSTDNTFIKAKNYTRDSFSLNFATNKDVVEIRGTITVSF